MSIVPTIYTDPNTYLFPSSGDRCWQLGGQWYNEILNTQPQIPRITARHAELRPVAEPLWRRLNALDPKARDQLGKQLDRQYGKVLEEYDVLDRALTKFAKLREMLVGLSRYMEKNKLVRKGDHDDYSFPYPLDKHWTAGTARSYTSF
ncbi:hypothetical protein V495_02720 [Pseudogymnoascus sp. VKM F-4514 (FW-929)]|nr:hypothetical protein V495_02720 [Pseudogymnoascus sp. VKM F-4514 (FW-929)]KFY65419.1 hypothetical protein V497_01409 [Pseudogymnoascus sp. VKM F-4516 (FW-969)]